MQLFIYISNDSFKMSSRNKYLHMHMYEAAGNRHISVTGSFAIRAKLLVTQLMPKYT